MKLTIKAKLLTNPEQHQSLKKTMEIFNDTCNYVSEFAYRERAFNAFKLHYLLYKDTRAKFPELSSQFVVRAFDKVAQSYKINKKSLHKFKKHSAVVYDQRLLSFKRLSIASINSVDGRLKIPNTSRACSICGFVSKSNRKFQSVFSCLNCGYTANADFNASINIALKGSVNNPIAVRVPINISPSLGTASSQL